MRYKGGPPVGDDEDLPGAADYLFWKLDALKILS